MPLHSFAIQSNTIFAGAIKFSLFFFPHVPTQGHAEFCFLCLFILCSGFDGSMGLLSQVLDDLRTDATPGLSEASVSMVKNRISQIRAFNKARQIRFSITSEMYSHMSEGIAYCLKFCHGHVALLARLAARVYYKRALFDNNVVGMMISDAIQALV